MQVKLTGKTAHKNKLNIQDIIKTIFELFSCGICLQKKCLHGKTQNQMKLEIKSFGRNVQCFPI